MWLVFLACVAPDNGAAPRDSGADTAPAGAPCTDLNCDGWPDLVVSSASQGPARVFWGSPDGFSDVTTLPVVWTKGNAQVDLDLDGDLDLVFARLLADGESLNYETESYVLYTESVDPFEVRVETLPTNGAHGVGVGDLDGDGLPDIVFSNHGDSFVTTHDATVYWNGDAGFDRARALALPALGGHGVSVADVDADGRLDVVLSNYYDGASRMLPSFVYVNGEGGLDPTRKLDFPTLGARGNLVADLDLDGHVDLLFANHYDGGHMDLDSIVYRGGPDGFDATRFDLFPTVGAHAAEAVDCDQDGDIDVFWANQRVDTMWTPGTRSWYYLGSPEGWGEGSRVELETFGASGTSARDLNRDGWVDLVVSNFREGETRDVPSHVYWGGPDCWTDARRTELATIEADAVSSGPGETGY